MAGKKEEIVVDVRSAVKLEQELQAHMDHGVVLIDVYSADWGPCKALTETFRALNNDAGAKLRILSAECHSILNSLKNPEERNHHRPKNMEASRETLPEAWQHIFEERAGLAKPFFLIYKEGRRCGAIDGVNTPVIRSMVKDLRTVRQPPENFLSGPLLTAWKSYFHNDESEISFDRFLKGLPTLLDLEEPFAAEERTLLMEALNAKDSKVVTADSFSRWVGDDSGNTAAVLTVFNATLSEYQARSLKAKAERESEEKAREDREADAVKKEDERRTAELAKEADAAESRTGENLSDIERWCKATGMTAEEAKDTPALRSSRKALAVERRDKVKLGGVLSCLPSDTAADVATVLAASLTASPTLTDFLISRGASMSSVHNIRRAVEKRFPQSSLLASGKMACLCLTSTADDLAAFTNVKGLDVLSSAIAGSVAANFPSVALAALTNGVSDAVAGQECLYFTAPAANVLGVGDVGSSVIVPPFTPFSTSGTRRVSEGDVTVVLKGTARAIFTAASTTRPASALALTAWFASYTVTSKDDSRVELTFTGAAFDDVLDSVLQQVRKSQSDEDEAHTAISQLQRAVEEKAALEGEAVPAFDEPVVKAPDCVETEAEKKEAQEDNEAELKAAAPPAAEGEEL